MSTAAHAIGLAAPADVVGLTIACCREMRERRLPLGAPAARSLLLAFRKDLGQRDVVDPEALGFEIIPSAPVRGTAPPAHAPDRAGG